MRIPIRACTVTSIIAVTWGISSALYGQAPDGGAQDAIARIKAVGGRVYSTPDHKVDIVALTVNKIADVHLELLQAIPTVRKLDLDGSRITDAGLEHLLKLPNLQEVSLRRTSVSSVSVAAFKNRHPGVYHVDVSSAARPAKLVFAAVMLIPLGFGIWLIGITRRKRSVLATPHYVRGIAWGLVLVVASGLMVLAAIAQSVGIEFHLSELFGSAI